MKATFENSVDVLVKAYINNELIHSFCSACAVGNLVAHAINDKPGNHCYVFASGTRTAWDDVFLTDNRGQHITPECYKGKAKAQIDSTGYTWEQLARIENAFERAEGKPEIRNSDLEWTRDETWMFNGLMAVVDVLADIHGVDLSVKEKAVGRFAEVHATK